ncbi:hypothetical protein ET475_07630 [Microbacterium protaetiae]|uniref:Uncharacterized protein n=1 Tax=Microbacterium protaetiae TaxID=2509458 RepID=A0A4P6ECS0_9MICO|nr:hypothetical protein [Microbacterium protaetiae]QAY59874.1 hypothetical protein ET475_07630 [Microbacterium protaetiae]
MLAALGAEHAVQARGEHAEPREDQGERQKLERRERHAVEQVHDRRDHQRAAQQVGEHHQTRRIVPAADDDGDQNAQEREDDAVGGALVQELVDIDREEPDTGQMSTRAGEQHTQLAGTGNAAQVLQGVHLVAHLQGEAEKEHSHHCHRQVEGVSGEVAEGAELAELGVQPRGVVARHHRHRRSGHEQRRHQGRPLRARQAAQAGQCDAQAGQCDA